MQTAEELNDTLKTETSTAVGRGTILEGLNVVLDGLSGDSEGVRSLSEHGGVVDSLGA